MINGAKVVCPSTCGVGWLNSRLLDFGIIISESTGEIKSHTKTAERNGLTFSIMGQTAAATGYCQILGSLHKYNNNGRDNLDDYTFDRLQITLNNLRETLGAHLHTAHIQTLEVGVNIPLDYSPDVITKNAISHRARPYTPLYTGRRKVGKICVYTDYTIKLYNKGQQCSKAGNVLRLEFKALRQRVLEPYGVRTLADLTDREKVLRLSGVLLDVLADSVFYDYSFKGVELSETKRLRFERYNNASYWENLDRRTLYKEMQKYAALLEKYRCIDWRKYCIKIVSEKLTELAELKAENGRHFPQLEQGKQADQKGTFSTLEYMVENVAQSGATGDVLKSEKTGLKLPSKTTTEKRRFCVVCGRDITDQKTGSRFCSELLYGASARQCRNRESNRRLALKRKIKRAKKKDLFLRITYTEHEKEYTDTLATSELSITREWLDRVTRVDVLRPQLHANTLTGNEAKKFLKRLNNK